MEKMYLLKEKNHDDYFLTEYGDLTFPIADNTFGLGVKDNFYGHYRPIEFTEKVLFTPKRGYKYYIDGNGDGLKNIILIGDYPISHFNYSFSPYDWRENILKRTKNMWGIRVRVTIANEDEIRISEGMKYPKKGKVMFGHTPVEGLIVPSIKENIHFSGMCGASHIYINGCKQGAIHIDYNETLEKELILIARRNMLKKREEMIEKGGEITVYSCKGMSISTLPGGTLMEIDGSHQNYILPNGTLLKHYSFGSGRSFGYSHKPSNQIIDLEKINPCQWTVLEGSISSISGKTTNERIFGTRHGAADNFISGITN